MTSLFELEPLPQNLNLNIMIDGLAFNGCPSPSPGGRNHS